MFDDDDSGEEARVEEETSSTWLTFDLGAQTLGVEVRHVREIIDCQRITPLPNAPMEVLGVVDVRSASVPIVDLRGRLGVSALDLGDDARIVIFEVGHGGRRSLGVQADRVRNVEQIGADEVESVPTGGIGGWDAAYLKGLCRRGSQLVVLVDLEHILGTGGAEIDLAAGSGFF